MATCGPAPSSISGPMAWRSISTSTRRTAKVRLRLVGAHNVMNALAAAAIGHAMGLSLDVIVRGLQQCEPAVAADAGHPARERRHA